MIRHYEGILGVFDYDDEEFEISYWVEDDDDFHIGYSSGVLNHSVLNATEELKKDI